ncbi:acyl-CoA desaturase [Tundrisphaera sp. TA3]|uniref:acyl-CoA desaturase n=1 Tax=Tundrisphaera sp. TA3 TaxID=3435775 RepID=UPI003EBDFA21
MTTTTAEPSTNAATVAHDDHQHNSIAWVPLAWIGFLHLGALLAFNPAWFSWPAVLLCVVLHWVTGGLGITLTYHRLLTHRSFQTRPKWLEYFLTIVAANASEGGPIGWVADHRRHHAHSDQDDDVHSPNRGFGWAHMFWWMTPDITSVHTPEYFQRWAPDLMRDPVHRFIDKYFIVFPILGAIALYAIGGMPYLVWGFFVRSVLVLHATWLVNSATHIWGYRSHETRDSSTNLWWVALVTYGEGWHNNHHAFQTSARHGMRWWEVDTTWMTIRVMKMLGLATSVKLPKLTHAAPIARAKKGQNTMSTARSADGEPELVGAAS